jgi:hypothetical protein
MNRSASSRRTKVSNRVAERACRGEGLVDDRVDDHLRRPIPDALTVIAGERSL